MGGMAPKNDSFHFVHITKRADRGFEIGICGHRRNDLPAGATMIEGPYRRPGAVARELELKALAPERLATLVARNDRTCQKLRARILSYGFYAGAVGGEAALSHLRSSTELREMLAFVKDEAECEEYDARRRLAERN
jgi:hypothetical protein